MIPLVALGQSGPVAFSKAAKPPCPNALRSACVKQTEACYPRCPTKTKLSRLWFPAGNVVVEPEPSCHTLLFDLAAH